MLKKLVIEKWNTGSGNFLTQIKNYFVKNVFDCNNCNLEIRIKGKLQKMF